jgi:sugar phosphate isomerase/epimerase
LPTIKKGEKMSRFQTRREFLRHGALVTAGTAAAALVRGGAEAIKPIVRKGESRLKVSCCAYSYRQFLSGDNKTMTLDDFLETAVDLGLDGVELTSYYFPQKVTPEYLNHLKRKAFVLGLDVSGSAVGNHFCNPPGAQREKDIEQIKQWVDYSAALGAPCIRVFGGNVPKGVSLEEAQKWTIESIEECCDYSGKRGVSLAMENHGGITASPKEMLPIVQAVKSEWFGVNLDTGNFRTDDPYADLATMAPYSITTHIKTQVGGRPADYKRIVAIMRDSGYRGYLSLEYEDREDPRTGVPKTINSLRESIG